MHFSLVLATVERTREVSRFLESLDSQSYRDFELIVVDQNPDRRLFSLLEPYMDRFSVIHLHKPSERGVSKARNLGLQHVNGTVVTWPDDDCWYPSRLLEQVAEFLNKQLEVDGVSGRRVSEAEPSHDEMPIVVSQLGTPLKVTKIPGLWSLFLRTSAVKIVGSLDETLGPGAGTPWGAGEDSDYYLRTLEAGFALYTNSDLMVFHPTVKQYYTRNGGDLTRSYRYGAGITRVWKRHRLPLWYFTYEVLRSSAGVLFSLMQARIYKAYWHWGALRGKFKGWFSKQPYF